MAARIALIGAACEYPDARSPSMLWENVLARRQAFRRIPRERVSLDDYWSEDPGAPDRFYTTQAALIEGYEFDRVTFQVPGSTFRATDLTHWLALDVAARALHDAGFPGGEGLPNERVAVVVGNTLTGEFTRASTMRLRWPYVRRTVAALLSDHGWDDEGTGAFLHELEARYKAPFPSADADTLAGGLSNTIAGRICNFFDLGGGGYTVDAACAASLLAVITGCKALESGDADLVIVGGVDLSIDPFELVGFAKAGALARDEMRVYDARSEGFWPGEGCGMAVLVRAEDAAARGRRPLALIQGWGVSSDGSGGITRPEVSGQQRAIEQAYARAGFSIGTVAYHEGHGTGTEAGDAAELGALSGARRAADPAAPPAGIGSVKANIGHTKAAAGIAGLLKAVMAMRAQVLPPTTGCQQPHPLLLEDRAPLRVVETAEPWPADRPLRASVSAMGFGGIDTHVVLEEPGCPRRTGLPERAVRLAAGHQDAELLVLEAGTRAQLRTLAGQLAERVAGMARGEVTDLAAHLARAAAGGGLRAATVGTTPEDLAGALRQVEQTLAEGPAAREPHLDVDAGVFVHTGSGAPRLGLLFPGQGVRVHAGPGALGRRFPAVAGRFSASGLPGAPTGGATAAVQPRVVLASMAGLEVLERLGVRADVAVGHSLGEVSALAWAGALGREAALELARARGAAMGRMPAGGAMLSVRAPAAQVADLLGAGGAVIACHNAADVTVVSGAEGAVAGVQRRASDAGWASARLQVSHAFHSPLVAGAAEELREILAGLDLGAPAPGVVSTVTGRPLEPHEDLRAILSEQLTAPVLFDEAVTAAGPVDLWIEVGPGDSLSTLVTREAGVAAVALDVGADSLGGLLRAAGAAFVLGAEIDLDELFAGRLTRPVDATAPPRLFANPCESAPRAPAGTARAPQATPTELAAWRERPAAQAGEAPAGGGQEGAPARSVEQPAAAGRAPAPEGGDTDAETVLALVQRLVSERAELPASALSPASRLAADLHLNSITASQLVADAARELGMPVPLDLNEYANATINQVAEALAARRSSAGGAPEVGQRWPEGVADWVRPFVVDLVERPLVARAGGAAEPASARQPAAAEPAAAGQPAADPGAATVLAPPGTGAASELARRLDGLLGAETVVLWVPPQPDASALPLFSDALAALVRAGERPRLVVVQHGGGGSGFARSVHLELPGCTTCVVDVPAGHPEAPDWVAGEAVAARGYVEAHYDQRGTRRAPVFKLLPLPDTNGTTLPLASSDVLLVTGGGKGLAAECAASLARTSGVALGLLGRSDPEEDAELAENLHRLAALGIRFHYAACDVTDAAAVRAAVAEVEATLGPPTGVLHGAGVNVPRPAHGLDAAAFAETVAPKVTGAQNVLDAVDPSRLRCFVAFGSLIARTGMPGEAHYALANEWLTLLVERLGQVAPECTCLSLEWSVWAGVGMGERLGSLDALLQQGITAIGQEDGTRLLHRLLSAPAPRAAVAVCGRFGQPPTLETEPTDLPLLRFLEQPRVHVPGVELVVDCEVGAASDPYVAEHALDGQQLLPAVVALEAMAQAVQGLTRSRTQPEFEDVTFERAVVVPPEGTVTLRIAALADDEGSVAVVLRTGETGFKADHFRARCRVKRDEDGREGRAVPLPAVRDGEAPVPVSPERELYTDTLFQRGRFQRVERYRLLNASECVAELSPSGADWFPAYLPRELVLGDPGQRDAAIHAIQACLPHRRLLPIGVDAIVPALPTASGPATVTARERRQDGDTFTFDLEVIGDDGLVQERWEGLRLRVVAPRPPERPWPEPLLAPYAERRARELVPGLRVALTVERGGTRAERKERGIQRLLGEGTVAWRRPDGKPTVARDAEVSVAHAGDVTLVGGAPGRLGCDLEAVTERDPARWRELVGAGGADLAELVAAEAAESPDTAATRVWVAREALRKLGALGASPLALDRAAGEGWVVLRAGTRPVVTFAAPVHGDRTLCLSLAGEV